MFGLYLYPFLLEKDDLLSSNAEVLVDRTLCCSFFFLFFFLYKMLPPLFFFSFFFYNIDFFHINNILQLSNSDTQKVTKCCLYEKKGSNIGSCPQVPVFQFGKSQVLQPRSGKTKDYSWWYLFLLRLSRSMKQ